MPTLPFPGLTDRAGTGERTSCHGALSGSRLPALLVAEGAAEQQRPQQNKLDADFVVAETESNHGLNDFQSANKPSKICGECATKHRYAGLFSVFFGEGPDRLHSARRRATGISIGPALKRALQPKSAQDHYSFDEGELDGRKPAPDIGHHLQQ